VTGLLARLRNRRAHRDADAQAAADAWLAPLINPARATTARAGAHPYDRPKGTHPGELTAAERTPA
jgi:hypothetical protein